MSSTRIASPCFTRAEFELGLSSRDYKSPPNELDRHDPSGLGSMHLCMRHDEVNLGLSAL